MKDILRDYTELFRKQRKNMKRYTAMLLVLALSTTLFVNWQLHGIGISMTAEYQCGMEEHEHTAACYEKVLTCGYVEGEPEDWNATPTPDDVLIDAGFGVDAEESEPEMVEQIETQMVAEPHVHTDECYEERKVLNCLEEEHVHDDDCFDPETNELICDKFEHIHDESCYTTERELVCGLEEGELVETPVDVVVWVPVEKEKPAAVQTYEAPQAQPVVTAPTHVHTDACYTEVLVCTKPEHHHTVECLSDPMEDVESEADWLAKTDTTLTGEWGKDLVTVAKSQIGYQESLKNFHLDTDDGETVRGYSRYGAWYGNKYGEWDVMFLSYCLHYANIPSTVIPQRAGVNALRADMLNSDLLVEADGMAAMPGDVVIYNNVVTETVAKDETYDDTFSDSTADVDPNPDDPYGIALYSGHDSRPVVADDSDLQIGKTGTVDTETSQVAIETVGIVTEVDENAGTLTVISGDVNGQVAEVQVSASDVTDVILVNAAYYAYAGDTTEDFATLEATQKAYDFTKDITDVSMSYRSSDSESWKNITGGTVVDEKDQIMVSMDYTLPPYTLSDNCNTIRYKLPDALQNFADTDTVYDSNGKAVGKATVENGYVTVTFFDSYVKKNQRGSPIEGTISFKSEAKEIKTTIDQETKIDFNDDCSCTVTVKDKEISGDIHTQKTTSDYDLENGKVKYTVKVWSNNGTAKHEITLKDVMSNIEYDTTQGFTVTKNGTDSVNGDSLTFTKDGFSGTLPALGENEYYEISYWGVLPENLKGGNVTAKNSIHAESKDSGERTIESDANVDVTFNNVKKEGIRNEANGTISWTVTLNESHTDISGWTLKDELNGKPYTGKVTITPSNGASFEAALPYEFGTNNEDTKASFTITYTTSDDHDYGTSQVTNKATLIDKSNGEKGSGESDINVGYKDPYFKTGTGFEVVNGKLVLKWHVKLITDHDCPSGWQWKDQPYTSSKGNYKQYFTPEQREELKKQLDMILGAGTYKLTEMYNGYEPEGNWDTLMITGLSDLKAGTYEFDISTTVDTVPDDVDTFVNNCYFNGSNFQGENNYEPQFDSIVKKVDSAAGSDASNTDHDYTDCNATLKWRIEVTLTDAVRNGSFEYLEITDTLPEGVDLTKLAANGGVWNGCNFSKTSDPSVWEGTPYFWSNETGHVGGAYEKPLQAKIATVGGKQVVTIQVPKDLIGYTKKGAKITFDVEAKITDDPKTWESSQKNFKNEVSIKDSNGTDWGSDDQTQEITFNKNFDAVQKSGTLVDTEGEGGAINTIEYSVVVNKQGSVILDDMNVKLTLNDELIYTYNPWNSATTVSLTPNSVKVYKYDETQPNQRGDELSTSEYSYLYETEGYGDGTGEENRTNRLKFTLPNGQPLVVVYRYYLTSPRQGNGVYSGDINNTATLYANTTKIVSSEEKQNVRIQDISSTANVKGVLIYKVDQDNNGLYLPGAQFSLYAWDGTAWKLVNDKITTNDEGELMGQTEAGLLKNMSSIMEIGQKGHNQAFKLVETKAPSGYKEPDPDNAYFFYIPDSNTTDYPMMLPSDLSGFHILSAGQNVYLTNEKDNSGSYTLPSTGGTGTTPFTAVGGAMALAALVCGACRKRRRERRAD